MKNIVRLGACGVLLGLLVWQANAAALYWDVNGSTAGSGGPSPDGTWSTTAANWSTDPSGAASTQAWVGTNSAFFSAGDDATNSYTVTIDGAQAVSDLWVKDGAVTFNGSNGGELDFTGDNFILTNYVEAGHVAVFNVPFGGSYGPDKWGEGTAVYNAASTVSDPGYFALNQGTIAIGHNSAFGNVELDLGDAAGLNTVTLCSADSTDRFLSNPVYFFGSHIIFDVGLGGFGGNLTLSSSIDLGSSFYPAVELTVNNTTTLSGLLTSIGGAGLTKDGNGTLVFAGSGANSYGSTGSTNGYTTVNGGTLLLQKTGTALGAGRVVINANGYLQLGAANQIGDAVPMTLSGGAFQTGGFNEQLGALTLAANSFIDLGADASTLKFASSSSVAWGSGTTLAIVEWSGDTNGGGTDRLIFGNTSAGLTTTQVSQIKFIDPDGLPAGTYDAQILSSGEVVPFPVLRPTLSISVSGTNVIVTWSGTFTLQVAADLNSSFSDVPGATSPYTNSILPGSTQFFRARQ